MRGLMVDVGFFLSFSFMVYFHCLNVFSFFVMFFLVLSVLLLAAYMGSALRGGTVKTHAQPPHTDVPQPRTDLSHSAQTFSEVGTGCTATGHMTSLLVYSPFSQELSSLSLNLVLDICNDQFPP